MDSSLKGVVGLQNMGNTCYANSTLQILRAVPEWSAFCMAADLSGVLHKEKKEAQIMLAYQDILKSLWSASFPSYVRPLGFLYSIQTAVQGTVYQSFGRQEPNDSHEYLIYLLDNFHEALKSGSGPWSSGACGATAGWDKFVEVNKSPVVDLFFGMIRKTIKCAACGTATYNWEPFNVFKIPCIDGDFASWLSSELATAELEDYDCVACRPTRQKASITNELWRLPPSLFVALRRFQFDGRKDMRSCPYNGQKLTFGKLFAAESPDTSREWTYEVRGVVDHHGNHMGGHYTAQFCNPMTKEFWWIDDERAQKMDKGPIFGQATYLLLLQRIIG